MKNLYERLTGWSVLLVILILLLQVLLIYRSFWVNHDYLEKLITNVACDSYRADLNIRMSSIPSDSLNVKIFRMESSRDRKVLQSSDRINGLTLNIESVLYETAPVNLARIDSLAASFLAKEDLHIPLNVRILDSNHQVVRQSNHRIQDEPDSRLAIVSQPIPVDARHNQLQIVLAHPLRAVAGEMMTLLIITLLCALFCIISLIHLYKVIVRQKQLSDSKAEFFNQVSHELKKPVTVAYQAIDSLLNPRISDDPERRSRYLTLSMREFERINEKIDMILATSMMDEGLFQLHPVWFDLCELMTAVTERYELSVVKPVSILFDCRLENTFVYADKGHLFQCISNLIENAIKYSGEQLLVKLSAYVDNSDICIAVQDNGFGIEESDLSRIFKSFERANTNVKTHGFGIGLSYVDKIMALHKGGISVQSKTGEGTTFIMHLPLKNNEP